MADGGFASCLGFSFALEASWGDQAPPFRVHVFGPDEKGSGGGGVGDGLPSLPGAARSARTRVVLAQRERSHAGSVRALVLDVDDLTARVEVDSEDWPGLAPVVLAAVAEFWRFRAIERRLGELEDWARADLGDTRLRTLMRPRRARALRAHHRALQALLLDLPVFEGALTDPATVVSPGRPARLFRLLAARLGLPRWRRLIDERVEVIEAVLDSLSQSLDHLQSLVWLVGLEVVIVAVLLVDTGLYLLDALAR
jgi:hypothetical protein